MATRFNGEGARPDFVPIRGWERVALVGLVAAVQDLADLVEDVREYALDAVEAIESRRRGGADPHGLTLEAAGGSTSATQPLGQQPPSSQRESPPAAGRPRSDGGVMDLECICPTHTVSVTYKLGVTAAVMIEVASLLEATEGKRPIILVAALGRKP
eukprot:COSAG01_NODE_18108_length_1100_cov_1.254745_1_plen_157_part_00